MTIKTEPFKTVNYGIWYDDGRLNFGWLAEEGAHGRPYRYETDDLEEATRKAQVQTEHDINTIFVPEPLNSDSRALFKRVRRLAWEKKLRKAEELVEYLRKKLAANP